MVMSHRTWHENTQRAKKAQPGLAQPMELTSPVKAAYADEGHAQVLGVQVLRVLPGEPAVLGACERLRVRRGRRRRGVLGGGRDLEQLDLVVGLRDRTGWTYWRFPRWTRNATCRR